MENRISFEISEEAMQNIQNAVSAIESNLPQLINLSDDERHALPKMGDKTVAFVQKAYDYAKLNESLVPAFLNMEEFQLDVKVVSDLSRILQPLQQLTEKIGDTAMLGGSEAYMEALTFYTAVKAAVKSGVPGTKTIYDDLQQRFPGRKGK